MFITVRKIRFLHIEERRYYEVALRLVVFTDKSLISNIIVILPISHTFVSSRSSLVCLLGDHTVAVVKNQFITITSVA